ncbi:DUF411 domain-containing protein [Roseomonas eburnea]|uniref:DUF411 domain-containing protein n=2 Tax=Neoroseomonas eburnea TaxID=1346889 RepID=A0A9X9XHQ5_9PROT|nr:DUF411 domain-containing protein [Neoroseomonas eburnea]
MTRMTIRRRDLMAGLGVLAALPAAAQGGPLVEVWRDPNCGCCSGWVAHMREAGFTVRETVLPALGPVRRMLGTPADLLSCHAARVQGIVLEGHVPAEAVRRVLAGRPAGLLGLAVPAMPVGAPGMEVPGQPDDIYDVMAFDAAGRHSHFMRFRGGQPI